MNTVVNQSQSRASETSSQALGRHVSGYCLRSQRLYIMHCVGNFHCQILTRVLPSGASQRVDRKVRVKMNKSDRYRQYISIYIGLGTNINTQVGHGALHATRRRLFTAHDRRSSIGW